MEFDEEPKDVMVLNSIFKGKDDEKKIAQTTGLSLFDVATTVERLIARGLVIREEKKGFFGKKIKLKLTEKGFRELEVRRYELEKKWERMVTLANNGNRQALQEYTESNRSWIWPMMMFGIIDMMMFMSMLSLMNLAISNFMPDNMADSDIAGDLGSEGGSDGSEFDFGDLGDISF